MEHIYKEKEKGAPVFVLLHGTGGNEKDLLPIAEEINPNYNQLGIRGNVNENGMNRFFKRHGEGQYDWEDLANRSDELYQFILEMSKEYDFNMDDLILLGFSNGSNIATQMILEKGDVFKKALLFAPMYPKNPEEMPDLEETEIFLSLGKNDPIVEESESQRLIDIFEKRKAEVTVVWGEGHRISPNTLMEAKNWLK